MQPIFSRVVAAGILAAAFASGQTRADNLAFGTGLEPSSIDPHFANLDPNVQIAHHIFDSLTVFDRELRLGPGLAESWRSVDDKTWEFKLRKGVTFHDGTPLTADDVVFTFQRVLDVPNSPSPMSGSIAGKIFTRIDDHTVQVTTKAPYPLTPNDMTRIAVISRKHGQGATTADYNAGKAAVGSGPYRFVEWLQGDRLVLQNNPNYWGGRPKWDRVTVKPIKSGPSRIAALLSGDVDMIDTVPPSDVARLRQDPKVVVSDTASARTIYLHVDSNRDLSPFVRSNDGTPMVPNALRKWEVRKALSMAINRKAIADRVMEGLAVPAGQMVPHGAFGFNPDFKPEAFDPEGAQKLLAQVGYPDGFRLTIHGPNDRYTNDAKILETIAQMWTRVGVKTEVATMPTSVYFGRASKLEFSVVLIGYQTDTGEASASLTTNFHTYNKEAGFGPYNRGRYSNVRLDNLLEQALATVDDGKREKLLHEAVAIGIKDVAVMPLHYEVTTWALRKGLTYEARTDGQTLVEGVSRSN